MEVLRHHRDWLVAERERLARLLYTVDSTITKLERGEEMAPETMFAGFEHTPYETEARERWGDDAVDATYARMGTWSADDAEKARTGYDRVHEGLASLLAEGVPASDERVQQLVDLHFQVTSLFWTPNAEAYRGLGQMYVDDEATAASIGQGNDALVTYLRDAIALYAEERLS